jgi:hypothetical protein
MKLKVFIFLSFVYLKYVAQEKPPAQQPKYDRKEEIIYEGNRYRIHNHYLTFGPGFLHSTLRTDLQKMLAMDYQFPVRGSDFQVGAMMSGQDFTVDNNIEFHMCYGFRSEKKTRNIAFYIGPSYETGVYADASGLPKIYDAFGIHMSLQGVIKFAYDIGIGAELFGEVNNTQSILGLKLVAFFSGAYRGAKKNFNPHVRSENPG